MPMTDAWTKVKSADVLCLFLVIGCAGILDVLVAKAMSTTFDEPLSIEYGELTLRGHPDRSDRSFDSKSPIVALNAIPRALATLIDNKYVSARVMTVLRSVRFARLASVGGILLLNVFIYLWARTLYGMAAAVAVSVLVLFSPNLIAHGTLANNDGYFALGVVVSLYLFRCYLMHPSTSKAFISGFALALAQLTKPFAIYLYAVVMFVLIVASIDGKSGLALLGKKEVIVCALVAGASFFLVINAGFCFDRSFTPLKSYHFDSDLFVHLQSVPGLRSLPLPLPYPFLQGLDMLKHDDLWGLTYGKIYLLGELRDPSDPKTQGFKLYYTVAMLFKEPLAIQVLCLIGLIWICKNRSYREVIAGDGMLSVAAVIPFVWFSLFRKSQLGIRSILPVVAIEVIIAGAAFVNCSERSRRAQIALGLLVLWTCVSTMTYFPNMIPYMNELVFDRKQAYKLLADSNLDFGQDSDIVREFLIRNPDVVLDPPKPITGRVLVSVNHLVGVWRGYEPMYWLLRYQPAASVGYGHLLFVVPAQDISNNAK